jgi:hypothetical protein
MGSLKNSQLILLPADPSDATEIFEMHLAAFSCPPYVIREAIIIHSRLSY